MPHWCRLHAASDIATCDDGMSLKEHYHSAVLRQVVAQKAQAHMEGSHTRHRLTDRRFILKVKDSQGKQRLPQKAKAHTESKGLHKRQSPLQEARTEGKGSHRNQRPA